MRNGPDAMGPGSSTHHALTSGSFQSGAGCFIQQTPALFSWQHGGFRYRCICGHVRDPTEPRHSPVGHKDP
jgi:hypothetical protein